MAHDLNIENGKAAMMFVGEVPWHGLGTGLKIPPKTAEDAIRAAGLDWSVGLKPVYVCGDNQFYEIQDRKGVVRLDKWGQRDCIPFGLVGNDYKVLQNREAFSFFDPVIETGKVNYETAGALGAGERVWILAKVEGQILVKGKDRVDKYLLLSNGHDGRTALQIRFTPIRVVCQNTLSMALGSGSDFFKIYHSPNMHRRIDITQEAVKKILGYYDDFAKQFDLFAGKQVDTKLLATYLAAVFPDPKPKRGQTERAYDEALAKIVTLRTTGERLFVDGNGNNEPAIKGTLWAAYNGVTEMVDHHWSYQDRWQRLNSLWFGDGERIKLRAFNEARKISLN